jgi:hypothetical protein
MYLSLSLTNAPYASLSFSLLPSPPLSHFLFLSLSVSVSHCMNITHSLSLSLTISVRELKCVLVFCGQKLEWRKQFTHFFPGRIGPFKLNRLQRNYSSSRVTIRDSLLLLCNSWSFSCIMKRMI